MVAYHVTLTADICQFVRAVQQGPIVSVSCTGHTSSDECIPLWDYRAWASAANTAGTEAVAATVLRDTDREKFLPNTRTMCSLFPGKLSIPACLLVATWHGGAVNLHAAVACISLHAHPWLCMMDWMHSDAADVLACWVLF